MPLLPLRSHLKTAALFYPVREHVRLTSIKDAEDLLRSARLRREVVLGIQDLEVLVYDTTGIKPIRAILPFARNIRVLVLEFPFKPIHLFPKSLIFDHLVSLSLNIPHAIVAPFLRKHPRLETLQLGACSSSNTQVCPLTHYSLHFPYLVELTCPPSCVRALIAGSIVNKIFTTYDGVKHPFPLYKLLNFHRIETLGMLTTLLIDFDHMTPQLLRRISAAAPALCALKLVESKFSRKGSSQDFQMPWHEPDWIVGFRSLVFLVEFELRTWYHLGESNDAEIQIIMHWVNIPPPRLRYVIVLSGVRQNERRRVVWNGGEMSILESTENDDMAFM